MRPRKCLLRSQSGPGAKLLVRHLIDLKLFNIYSVEVKVEMPITEESIVNQIAAAISNNSNVRLAIFEHVNRYVYFFFAC